MDNYGIDLVFFVRETGRQVYRNEMFQDLPERLRNKTIMEFIRLHKGYQVECIPGADLVMHPGGWETLVKCFCRSWEGYIQILMGAHKFLGNDGTDTGNTITTEALIKFKPEEKLMYETGHDYFGLLMNDPAYFYSLVCSANYDYLFDTVASQYNSALPTFALGGGCYGRS